jgi:hypothetical protein
VADQQHSDSGSPVGALVGGGLVVLLGAGAGATVLWRRAHPTAQ